MELLPEERERAALLRGLAALIEARGFETFVGAPLLEPSARFFPDPWEPSTRGVRALALRLLRYAGNDELDAKLTLHDDGDGASTHEGAVAWFGGIEDGACVFGVNTSQLREGDAVVGTLCHEIAHAYRAWTDLAEAHDRLEEENTDLTTVYLGFGVLTTNNAYRFRKSGEVVGGMATTRWSTSHTGYLSAQAMAFALAAQVTARGMSAADAKRIGALLETNQRAFFDAARKHLGKDVDDLRVRLGIPPREVWPEPQQLVLFELPEDARFEPRKRATGRGAWNSGANVFRVRARDIRATTIIAGALGGAVLGVVTWKLFDVSYDTAVVTASVLGTFAGLSYGWRRKTDTCSEPRCEATLPADDSSSCPRCGGRIRGVIGHANERLAAEERLEDDEGSSPYR